MTLLLWMFTSYISISLRTDWGVIPRLDSLICILYKVACNAVTIDSVLRLHHHHQQMFKQQQLCKTLSCDLARKHSQRKVPCDQKRIQDGSLTSRKNLWGNALHSIVDNNAWYSLSPYTNVDDFEIIFLRSRNIVMITLKSAYFQSF